MITVSVKLTGLISKYYRSKTKVKQETAELEDGSTVADLLDLYKIPYQKAHILVVNRYKAELTTVLKSDDNVWVLPLAHGG
ncbi:MAG: MoaD/ThiS family protein [SAR324 cluster bacterium]|nr:MoaD/ThiS family protein [SAR324 cluster bacterium]